MRADLQPWTLRGFGLALGVLLVVGIVQLALAAGDVLLLLFVAILFASALAPVVGFLRERTPASRAGALLVVYLTFLIGMVGLAFIVVPAAITQAQDIVEGLPPFIEQVQAWLAELRPRALARSVGALVDSVASALKPPPPDPDAVVDVGTAVAEAAVWLATLLVLVFFWLVEHARLQRYVLAFVPQPRRAGTRAAWNEIEGRLGGWVRGQLILMAAIGLATGIAYTVLGLPGALLLALIAAITEAIPLIGPLIGAVPAVLVAATVSPELAIVVAIVYLVLQLIEGAVLVPMVMRNTVGISPFLILVSLLIGGAVAGIVGALLAVPIAAAAEIILNRLQDREVAVAQDPAGVETPDADAIDAMEVALPDGAGSSAS